MPPSRSVPKTENSRRAPELGQVGALDRNKITSCQGRHRVEILDKCKLSSAQRFERPNTLGSVSIVKVSRWRL
jgi:hypothetical protein